MSEPVIPQFFHKLLNKFMPRRLVGRSWPTPHSVKFGATFAAILLVGCQTPADSDLSKSNIYASLPVIAPAPAVSQNYQYTVPDNGYTPQTTLAKYQAQYPQLKIPDAQLLKGVRLVADETYKTLGQRELKLDWFLPEEVTRNTPLVALVHGGGWASGAKENFHSLANHLAERGLVAVTLNYRLSGEAKFPAAIEDIKDALVHIQNTAEARGWDARRVSIAGGSAGGQLAALAGLTGPAGVAEREYLPSPNSAQLRPAQTIINLDGVMDFTDPAALINENDPRKHPSAAGAFFGGRYQDMPEVWRAGSPNTHLNAQAAPMLFIRSSVPRFSVGYLAAMDTLRAFNISTREHLFADAPHSYWLFDPWVGPSADLITDFILANPPRE